jgi:hypothetical protein
MSSAFNLPRDQQGKLRNVQSDLRRYLPVSAWFL